MWAIYQDLIARKINLQLFFFWIWSEICAVVLITV